MNPESSGLMYCTTAALCNPRAPAVSLLKHATQMPMLAGLPRKLRTGASTPTTAPVTAGPIRDINNLLRLENISSDPPFIKLFALKPLEELTGNQQAAKSKTKGERAGIMPRAGFPDQGGNVLFGEVLDQA
jgi:hypothetical protein